MCSDYKLFAKILGNRMKKVIDLIIHRGQYGVPGQCMREGHGRIRDFLEGRQRRGGGVLGIDWKQAYDCIDRRMLRIILQAQGFGDEIVRWVNTLYTPARVRV